MVAISLVACGPAEEEAPDQAPPNELAEVTITSFRPNGLGNDWILEADVEAILPFEVEPNYWTLRVTRGDLFRRDASEERFETIQCNLTSSNPVMIEGFATTSIELACQEIITPWEAMVVLEYYQEQGSEEPWLVSAPRGSGSQ